MTIVLDHTIVPVADKRRSAHLFADLIGATPGIPAGPFVPSQCDCLPAPSVRVDDP